MKSPFQQFPNLPEIQSMGSQRIYISYFFHYRGTEGMRKGPHVVLWIVMAGIHCYSRTWSLAHLTAVQFCQP